MRKKVVLWIGLLVVWELSQIAIGTYMGVRLACEVTREK